MGDHGFFRGTSSEQDNRFSNKNKKLLKTLKFPDNFELKVDMEKVNLEVMKPWISKKITELLEFEDEVVTEMAFDLLENPQDGKVDPRMVQINLTGFLQSKTPEFVAELWTLLLSAQESPIGIPTQILEAKKAEIAREKQAQQALVDQVKAKRDAVQTAMQQGQYGLQSRAGAGDSKRPSGRSGGRWDDDRRRPPPRQRSRSRSRSRTPDRDRGSRRRYRSRSRSRDRHDRRYHSRSRSPYRRDRDRHDRRRSSRSRSRSRSPHRQRRRRRRHRRSRSGSRDQARDRRHRRSTSADRDRDAKRPRSRRESGGSGTEKPSSDKSDRADPPKEKQEQAKANNNDVEGNKPNDQ